jgi:NAD(P)-dependent dehydrogenase (short-subunit alcohol dehydrogenase family)
MRLQGKVAIITGAASGIGRATALRFAQEGAKVVVADVQTAGGEQTVALARQAGGAAHFVATDVSREEEIRAMIEAAVTTYGGLDILHNNACATDPKTAEETTVENFEHTINVCLRAALLGAKYAAPHMRARGGGVILTTASIHSIVGFTGFAAYQCAKGGLLSLTRALALELAPTIRVVAILPGAIDTPALRPSPDVTLDHLLADIPLGRFGTPEEIAGTAAFLASADAGFITGTAIVADGGYTTR